MSRNLPDLRSIAFKVRGIAYLFSLKRFDQLPPMDIEDINRGIGAVLDELGQEIGVAADHLEGLSGNRDDSSDGEDL